MKDLVWYDCQWGCVFLMYTLRACVFLLTSLRSDDV